ncbi:hypothetical protein AVEN_223672-1 [Araneus ventricosus]|uniref:Uncharacterized protein n=1 Tax=Araneus ventricosus TaxID=182803 RepID=A0A4Y2QRP4_ARAVE|nr:hypothetical protein AVEN_223672-1 [Araneus ventricosus]
MGGESDVSQPNRGTRIDPQEKEHAWTTKGQRPLLVQNVLKYSYETFTIFNGIQNIEQRREDIVLPCANTGKSSNPHSRYSFLKGL